jgi:hypothetical protein
MRRAGAIAIVAIGTLALLALPAASEPSTSAAKVTSDTARAPAKAAAKKRQARPAGNVPAQAEPEQWSIKDALPKNSRALAPNDDPKAKTPIGRLPWQSGSVGFETDTKIKSTEFPDGNRLPGADSSGKQPPSYLGLSLSLPTNDKSLLPPLFGGTD